ncbi:MAG: methyltransferase domain-containing protein [Planctomycetaceae bacterium]|jgi:predicted O-methyltransferase YrrM|nr:methyltransferase domain-containing protein [Planctomycetaceae bacterium]
MPKPDILARLEATAAVYQEASLLAAGAELDVFTVLLQHSNRLTAGELSQIISTDLRGTACLLDALAAAGYLVKKDDAYSVADDFQDYLDRRSPVTYIPMIRHRACVQRAWTRLSEAVKTGTPPKTEPSILGAAEDRNSFIWAMNSVAQHIAGDVLESLRSAGLLSFQKLLDIGGASGTYTQAFLNALPKSAVTIFDLPVGIAAARKRFTASEYEQRVQFAEGDILKNDFPTGFDFAWISAIIHQFDSAECRILYQKTYQALNPGGKVAVRDFIMHSDRTQPKAGAFFGVDMLVETPHGQVYTFDEVRSGLESAGFSNVELAVPAETMSAVVAAVRK